jgi:hypothetical protein
MIFLRRTLVLPPSGDRSPGRRKIGPAADDENPRAGVPSKRVKGGVMLTYAALRAMREKPDRRSRAARQIALSARAEARRERHRGRRRK